jgi:hypothetical protein
MPSERPPRTDPDSGAAYAGSQLQTQLYVNRRTPQLDTAIRTALPDLADATFDWRSPLAGQRYREYRDAAFLHAVDLREHAGALAAFWPRGGPHWDAVAVVTRPGRDATGVLLAEGKSYPGEMLEGSAVSPAEGSRSRTRIENALAWTQGRLGIELNVAAWTGSLYQNANRLATLVWLRDRGVDAWLVHLLFTGDRRSPTTAAEWEHAAADADKRLGLPRGAVPWATHVTPPAGTYDELTGARSDAAAPG